MATLDEHTEDPKPRVERSALSEGAGFLARRPLTRRELADRLARRGHAAESVREALDRLEADGYLDDYRLARHYATVRAVRKAHGPGRLILELERRGVDPDIARGAVEDACREGDLDPVAVLRDAATRRVAALGGRSDRRAYARVYNALLRAGFEPDAVRRELAAHFPEPR